VDEGPGRFPERSFASQCGRARAYPQAAIPTVEVAQSVETVCILSEDDQKINNNKPGNKIIVS
jgi:hypothetical protein